MKRLAVEVVDESTAMGKVIREPASGDVEVLDAVEYVSMGTLLKRRGGAQYQLRCPVTSETNLDEMRDLLHQHLNADPLVDQAFEPLKPTSTHKKSVRLRLQRQADVALRAAEVDMQFLTDESTGQGGASRHGLAVVTLDVNRSTLSELKRVGANMLIEVVGWLQAGGLINHEVQFGVRQEMMIDVMPAYLSSGQRSVENREAIARVLLPEDGDEGGLGPNAFREDVLEARAKYWLEK